MPAPARRVGEKGQAVLVQVREKLLHWGCKDIEKVSDSQKGRNIYSVLTNLMAPDS
jgi:hypothetical protein